MKKSTLPETVGSSSEATPKARSISGTGALAPERSMVTEMIQKPHLKSANPSLPAWLPTTPSANGTASLSLSREIA